MERRFRVTDLRPGRPSLKRAERPVLRPAHIAGSEYALPTGVGSLVSSIPKASSTWALILPGQHSRRRSEPQCLTPLRRWSPTELGRAGVPWVP